MWRYKAPTKRYLLCVGYGTYTSQLAYENRKRFYPCGLLDAKKPGWVYLPNLRSAERHAQFVQNEIMELARTGRIVEWHYPDGQLPIVMPLGVAEKERLDEVPKLRLIFDARYVNLFIRYEKYNYAKLRDILQYLGKGGWCGTSDFKSGYHALLLHPDMAQHCQWDMLERNGLCLESGGLRPSSYPPYIF